MVKKPRKNVDPVAAAFGKRLETIRNAKGITLADLAAQSGLQPNHIYMLEAGLRSPSWKTVLALAQALGVSIEAFRDNK